MCDLARDDWTVVKQALSDAPPAVDALLRFVTQTPRLHPDGDNNYTPEEWVFEEGDLTPTPPQTGRAYSRAMKAGPISLASQLLGSRCTKLVAAARRSQFFEGMINRLALLVAFAEDDWLDELPMIALDGLFACDDSLAVWRALKCWPDIDEFLEVLAEEGGEAEGGPGKQVTTTGVGPGNISRWKLIFSKSLSLRYADILGPQKKTTPK